MPFSLVNYFRIKIKVSLALITFRATTQERK